MYVLSICACTFGIHQCVESVGRECDAQKCVCADVYSDGDEEVSRRRGSQASR